MKPRILIVDDNPEACRVFSMMLAMQGYRTEIASNGLEALARIHRNPPDLIVLDLNLPGIRGDDVCREVRASRKLRHIPIILVTGHLDERGNVVSSDCGDAFFPKPVKLDEMLAAMSDLLTRRAASRDTRPPSVVDVQDSVGLDALTG